MKRLAAVLTALAVSGCMGSADTIPPDNFYRLRVSAGGQALSRPLVPGTVQVSAFEGDALLHGRPVLYSADGGSGAVRQHNYHYWADPPTRMVQDELAAFVRRRGLARSVVTPSMRADADYELRGRLRHLEMLTGSGGTRVLAELDLSVVRVADGKVMVANTYLREGAAEDGSVSASVTAMNDALAEIFAGFAADLDRSPALAETR
jgi:ABC-type uncharacterized transport system auxiliary subunit